MNGSDCKEKKNSELEVRTNPISDEKKQVERIYFT
jgi:hypothetical protein